MKATFIPNETLANIAKIAKPGEAFSLGHYPPGSVVVKGDSGLVVGEPDWGDLTVSVGDTMADPDADADDVTFVGRAGLSAAPNVIMRL